MTQEERERDILLKAEAVEVLQHIRHRWPEIEKHGGVGRIEMTSLKDTGFSGFHPSLSLPAGELEGPLRKLAAEWMARFITAAEALCLDVIENGEAAIWKENP